MYGSGVGGGKYIGHITGKDLAKLRMHETSPKPVRF